MLKLKFLITGDWHITNKTPRSRLDDYPDSQSRKIDWIIGCALVNKCCFILQPGDLFDHYSFPDSLKTKWIDRLLKTLSTTNTRILTVPGQHDLR